MSNNIVRDVSDYLKELDSKMSVFREKEDKLKKLEKKVNKARLDETISIDELGNRINEYIEIKKEVEAESSHKFFDEYKDLSDMYNEYYERIKGLKFKLSPYSNIDEYGDYVMRNFDVIFSNLKKEDIANSKQINYYLDDIAHYENKMKIIYEDLQKLEEKMFPSLEEKIENKTNDDEINNEIEENNNVINSSDILEKQNKNDSNDTISEYNYGLPEENNVQQNSNMDNEQGRVIVKGATSPANLFEVVAPNENFKVKRQERKLVGAYPLTVEELEKNSGLEKEKKKTVMKIILAPKKIFDSIKRKFQEHLEKKEQKQLERQIIEDKLSNSGDFEVEPPVIEKEYEEIINERPNTVNTENNPEVTKVFAR